MNEGLTKTEIALLEALQRERVLLQQRDWVSGIILHELSNAITIVSGSVDLINLVPPGSPAYKSSLQQLQNGSSTLRQLLAGLRVLIDSTGTPPAFEHIDMAGFVRDMIADPLLMGGGDGRRIVLRPLLPGSVPWRISPGLMRHALGNVLRNALRYSQPGSGLSVVIGGRGRRNWIHVLNRGKKIPPALQARLFDPGKKSTGGGMGLGLYIAQTCAERMGGRLVFGSTHQCTVFSIVLEDAAGSVLDLNQKTAGLAS
jgi:signal transduction histidine kinase